MASAKEGKNHDGAGHRRRRLYRKPYRARAGRCRRAGGRARQPLHRLRHRPARANVAELIEDHGVEAIIHFAGSTIVPDSVKDPLGYYGNNTANSRALIEAAVRGGVRHFIFSSTAAVYGNPAR